MKIRKPTIKTLSILAAVIFVLSVGGAFLIGGLIGKLKVAPLNKPIEATEELVRSAVAYFRGDEQNQRYVETALLELKMTSMDVRPDNEGDNAGFSPLGDGYLIGSRPGKLFHVKLNWPADYHIEELDLVVPVEKARFLKHPITKKHPRIPIQFGLKDVLVLEKTPDVEIYASHHFWHGDRECAVMRVSKITLPKGNFRKAGPQKWKTLYETRPCLKLDGKFNRIGEDDTFLQAGGRLSEFDEGKLLISVGDHFMDGFHNENLVQDPEASYGKTIVLDRESGEDSVYTLGHRNPQGLFQDQYGLWWETEHGPRGGDELNQLVLGANYGWPEVSYGTLYAGYLYPEGVDWRSHDGYEKPKYHWPPRTAASNIIRLDDSQLNRWQDDLLMATLGGRSLFRIRLDGTSVIHTERIEIGDRIRDLMQANDGTVLLMTDSGTFIRLESVTAEGGVPSAQDNPEALARALWMQCSGCHATSDGGHHIGPSLKGVVGRDVASLEGFQYSPALEGLDGEWTQERLDQFLANPAEYVPGTTMAFAGIRDPEHRKAIIAYLAGLD